MTYNYQLKTPVVFLIFNRPDTTEKVFESIRQAKPLKLLVIADGPRTDRPGEAEKCAATRAIIERVDWECEVLKNYSEINLSCAKRVSSGLNWVFEQVEDAIILEDDCVPHPSFFRFCEELLERYKDDSRVVSISGQNVQFGRQRTEYSYYFSRYNHCWGWATWKRAWQYFDFEMKLWPEVKKHNFLGDILIEPQAIKHWTETFQSTYDGQINSWANRWTFACWMQNGLSILANTNLISNIGFGTESTHTGNKKSKFANIPTEAVEFPLKEPPFMIRDMRADSFTQSTLYHQTFLRKLKKNLKKNVDLILSK
ncbi:glycosyltransferase family A protein [Lyngbya aestuarii]|uniref:glycosyltransferase family A protein n=1 Tax=Lyngbya aestuarii TaxID=118322 RepID=UPI00403D86F9